MSQKNAEKNAQKKKPCKGYDSLMFEGDVERYMCCVCLDVARDPVVSQNDCEHMLCFAAQTPNCPMCRTPVQWIRSAKHRNEIKRLKVKEGGKTLQQHLEEKSVTCPKCNKVEDDILPHWRGHFVAMCSPGCSRTDVHDCIPAKIGFVPPLLMRQLLVKGVSLTQYLTGVVPALEASNEDLTISVKSTEKATLSCHIESKGPVFFSLGMEGEFAQFIQFLLGGQKHSHDMRYTSVSSLIFSLEVRYALLA